MSMGLAALAAGRYSEMGSGRCSGRCSIRCSGLGSNLCSGMWPLVLGRKGAFEGSMGAGARGAPFDAW